MLCIILIAPHSCFTLSVIIKIFQKQFVTLNANKMPLTLHFV